MDEFESRIPETEGSAVCTGEAPAGVDLRSAKRVCSRVGFALLVTGLLFQGLSYGLGYLAIALETNGIFLSDTTWFRWVAGVAPLYIIGMPVGILIMRKVPKGEIVRGNLKFGQWLLFLLMCFPLMYGGNLIGTLLSWVISGGTATNHLLEYALENSFLKVLVIVILAPVLEEYLFRKQLVDRLAPYGEKTAILFSGITFGLFHMNLYQFFYACLLGMLFAFVYVRTRKLYYSIGLHMVINLLGSVVAPALTQGIDKDVLTKIVSGNADMELMTSVLPQLGGLIIYALCMVCLAVAGLVLLLVKAPKFRYKTAEKELPRGSGFRTVYCSVGVILFILFCLGMCGYALFR